MSKQWENNLKALYQQSRQELPPPELDQNIRVAAQKAVQRKSPHLKWFDDENLIAGFYSPHPEKTFARKKPTFRRGGKGE